MSIINLGLQCIGIMRAKLSDEPEEEIKKLQQSTTTANSIGLRPF